MPCYLFRQDSDFWSFPVNCCQSKVTKGHTIHSHTFKLIETLQSIQYVRLDREEPGISGENHRTPASKVNLHVEK